MRTKPNEAIRTLRRMIGQTQGEFAAMIGASKETVVSWENGRNKLSPQFARRIALATGVEAEDLLHWRRALRTYVPMAGHLPFTAETFARHRESYWGSSDEAAARRHLKHCGDALGLLFVAAAKPVGDQAPCRLPAVVASFIQWCEQTREDFQLDPGIQEQLEQRKSKVAVNQTYREWRAKEKEDPRLCRLMGFRDDPGKRDEEYLRLELETVPLWRPGHSMRG